MTPLRHMDPYTLTQRRQELAGELLRVDREIERRAQDLHQQYLKERATWCAEQASTIDPMAPGLYRG